MLYRLLQSRVLLAHNFTQLGRLHARFLLLLVWPASFHRLMLPCIPNQKDAVGRTKAVEKFVHLLRACKTRFIDDEKPFLSILGAFRPEWAAFVRCAHNFLFPKFWGLWTKKSPPKKNFPNFG